MAVPAQGLPARVAYPRGRRPRRPAEREGGRPDRGQGGVRPPARRRRADHHRGRPASCTPKWVPQLADAEELFPLLGDLAGRACPVLVPNERGLDRALAAGAREVAVFASATETFAQGATSTARSTSRWPCSSRSSPGREAEGLACPRLLSMCFGDPWEGAGPGPPGRRGSPRGCIDLGCDELSLGDTIGVATPGQVRGLLAALDEAGVPAERARRALPRHLRPGAGQHPRRAAARRHHRRRLRRRPRRLPVRQERHRQPRHRGPRLDAATASASRPASTSAASPPPACGWPSSSAAPAPPAPSAPSPTAGAT